MKIVKAIKCLIGKHDWEHSGIHRWCPHCNSGQLKMFIERPERRVWETALIKSDVPEGCLWVDEGKKL